MITSPKITARGARRGAINANLMFKWLREYRNPKLHRCGEKLRLGVLWYLILPYRVRHFIENLSLWDKVPVPGHSQSAVTI